MEENVNLCDLFATLCELAGLDLPAPEQTVNGAGLDSRSLVPLMKGQTDDWQERYDKETISQIGNSHLMIKRGELKYLYYGEADPEHQEVLFDHETDPGETRDLSGEPEYEEVLEVLRTRRAALGFGPNADPDYQNAGYRRCDY